jgi:hypothetical protein
MPYLSSLIYSEGYWMMRAIMNQKYLSLFSGIKINPR